MDWLDLLAVQGTLKSLLQHHSSKASILRCSALFIVQLLHPYITTGKTTALIRQTFVGKVMSLLFSLVITFLPRSKRLWMWTIDFSVRFSSLSQSCSTLCDPMNCSTPGFSVYHQLPELAQTHVHWVSDAIQPWTLGKNNVISFNYSQHVVVVI